MVEFFNRWSPPFAHAKRSVENGELGDLIAFSAQLNDSIHVPTKMLSWASKSSPAWFLMSHTADLAFWITGKKPSSVYAQGVKKVLSARELDTFDLIEAFVEYPDGMRGHFSNCWVLPQGMPIVYELKMRIVGSEAAIDIDTSDQEIHFVSQNNFTHPITDMGDVLGQYVGHPYSMLRAFIENILRGSEPLVGVMDGWYNTRFLCAVHESVNSGKKIKLDW